MDKNKIIKKKTWEEVKEKYEKNNNIKLSIKDWSTPELVEKYIDKYRLYSSSAEIIFSLNRCRKNKIN